MTPSAGLAARTTLRAAESCENSWYMSARFTGGAAGAAAAVELPSAASGEGPGSVGSGADVGEPDCTSGAEVGLPVSSVGAGDAGSVRAVSCAEGLPPCAGDSEAAGGSPADGASAVGHTAGVRSAAPAAGTEGVAVASAGHTGDWSGDSIAASGGGSSRGGGSIGSGGRQSTGGDGCCTGTVHSEAGVSAPALGGSPGPESGARTGEALDTVMSPYSTTDTWSTPGGVSSICITDAPGWGVIGEADAACWSWGGGTAPGSEPCRGGEGSTVMTWRASMKGVPCEVPTAAPDAILLVDWTWTVTAMWHAGRRCYSRCLQPP